VKLQKARVQGQMTYQWSFLKQEGKRHVTGCIGFVWHYGKRVNGQMTGQIPPLSLYQKSDLKQCIALVSHANKILLKIILERIKTKTESEIADEQAGFRRGRGTRDQVTNLMIIMQKAREHQQHLYMCFVDFKKAFDLVSHERIWTVMLEMGFRGHIVNLL